MLTKELASIKTTTTFFPFAEFLKEMKASAFNINNDETAHYIIIVNGVINRTRQY